jgi:nucleobase:cation symporter-1, NCS1 family
MFYFWGYTSAFVVYAGLSYFFPAEETQIPATIYDDDTDVVSAEDKGESDTPDEKKTYEVDASPV